MYKIFLFVIIAACLASCQETPQQITNNESSKSVDSIKSVYQQLIKTAEEVDADRLITFFSRSPQLRFANQDAEVIRDYDSLHHLFRNVYSGLSGQVIKMDELSIHMIAPGHALTTVTGEFTATAKDNTTMGGPLAWTFVFIRESGQWKVLSCHQSIKWR